MRSETQLTPQPACLTLSAGLLWERAWRPAENRIGTFAKQPEVWFAWDVQFWERRGREKSREVCMGRGHQ